MFPIGQVKRILSHPNGLTLFRVAASPIIVVLFFSAAAITDFLDGFFARQKGLVSNFGKVMDPIADKVLVSTSFIMLTALGWIPAWMVCIIIGREISVTGLRNIIAQRCQDLSASSLGKYKTGFQIAAIIPLTLHFPYFGIDFHAIGILFLWVALLLTIWSGADYFIRFRSLLRA